MDEHRDGKIASGKLYCDHRQVTTNGVFGGGIRGLIALDLDRTTIGQKVKVMSCFLVAESHPLIATGVYACKIPFLNRRRLLGYCA